MLLENIFRMPIGDWSDDGHGKCDYWYFKSNKTIEEVREAHFKIKEVIGIDIHSFGNEYQDFTFPPELRRELIQLGFDDPYLVMDPDGTELDSEMMASIWEFLLLKADPDLKLERQLIPPMIPFYGFDAEKRHIGFVGYGLFY
jgi:hypothetical protein